MTEQFVPTILVKNGQEKVVNDETLFGELLEMGWQVQTPKPTGNSRSTNRGAVAPRTPKSEISREEARQMADKRLAERIGIPSGLAEHCKAQGENFSVTAAAKVTKHLENWSARIADYYPVSQVQTTVNGQTYTFCVLFTDVDAGTQIQLHFTPDEDGITRSGVLCDVKI